jgi:glycosyltransferase involved in cell wall biosynthesis
MRIGIVLAAIPGYSETFFRNKIKFLNQTSGIEIILYVDQKISNIKWNESPIVFGASVQGNVFSRSFYFIFRFVRLLVLQPTKSLKLFIQNRATGFGFTKNLKSLLQSSHILGSRLDWLHFGFGTMAIGRENVARVIKARMAVSFRGFDIAIYPLKHLRCYDLVWSRVDKVHVISDDLGGLVHTNGYPYNKFMQKITPAIDTSKFKYWGENLHISTDQLKIVTVARLHWKKGLELTIDALSILKKRGINFHYTIIGAGEEYERLVFAVHQLGLKDQVFFAGKLLSDEVIEYLEASDLYIQYSIQEGFCNSVLEAQAMGLLCVVSDAEGLSENVIDKQTGWVVPKRNPALLADKVLEIVSMEGSERNQIRYNAINRVVNNFNLERQKKMFLQFYES